MKPFYPTLKQPACLVLRSVACNLL